MTDLQSQVESVLGDVKRDGRYLRAHCPNHVDRTPSLTVYEDGHYHCFSCNYHGWLDDLTGEKRRDRPIKERKKEWPRIDWTPCKNAFKKWHMERLQKWRGYNHPSIVTMASRGWIGIFEDQFCFPIYQSGRIVRLHVRAHEDRHLKKPWFYEPTPGASATAFVIAGKEPRVSHIFESQWDMFALISQYPSNLMNRAMFIATRGAANSSKLGDIHFPPMNYIWPQSDGAAERWTEGVVAYLPKQGKHEIITTPEKDPNDYLKSGGDLFKLL